LFLTFLQVLKNG